MKMQVIFRENNAIHMIIRVMHGVKIKEVQRRDKIRIIAPDNLPFKQERKNIKRQEPATFKVTAWRGRLEKNDEADLPLILASSLSNLEEDHPLRWSFSTGNLQFKVHMYEYELTVVHNGTSKMVYFYDQKKHKYEFVCIFQRGGARVAPSIQGESSVSNNLEEGEDGLRLGPATVHPKLSGGERYGTFGSDNLTCVHKHVRGHPKGGTGLGASQLTLISQGRRSSKSDNVAANPVTNTESWEIEKSLGPSGYSGVLRLCYHPQFLPISTRGIGTGMRTTETWQISKIDGTLDISKMCCEEAYFLGFHGSAMRISHKSARICSRRSRVNIQAKRRVSRSRKRKKNG
jgi:hypothetical protein